MFDDFSLYSRSVRPFGNLTRKTLGFNPSPSWCASYIILSPFLALKKSFVLHGAQVIKQQQVGPQIQPCQNGCLLNHGNLEYEGKKTKEEINKLQKLGTKTSINGVSFSQIFLRQETKKWFFSLGISSNMYHQWLWSWRGQFSSNSRVPGVHPKDLIFWRGSGFEWIPFVL